MKRIASYLLVAFTALACLSGCGREAKVMPPNTMSQIYFDMFIMDKWIRETPKVKLEADTTLVYEAIFRKYGYDTDDYNKSLDYYLDHPEQHIKIVQATVNMLNANAERAANARIESDRIDAANEIYRKYRKKDFLQDSVRWKFGKIRETIDSILTDNKWLISQENMVMLPTD